MLMKSLFFPFVTLLLILTGYPSANYAGWQPHSQSFDITYGGGFLTLESDKNGHGMILTPNYEENVLYFSNGTWKSQLILENVPVMALVSLAVEDSGTALAMWSYENIWETKTAYFDGTIWKTPCPDPFENGIAADTVSIAMNGPGHGMMIWLDYNATNLQYSIFSNESWGPAALVTEEAVGNPIYLAYSKNGTAVAGFESANTALLISIFDGINWQAPSMLDSSISVIYSIGIDDNGNAIVLALNNTLDIVVSNYDGTNWKNTILAKGNEINAELTLDLDMSEKGTAIVVWKGLGSKGFSSYYNGKTWETPRLFASDIGPSSKGPNISVSINEKGNSLVVWSTAKQQVKSSRLPAGGTWKPAEIVEASAPEPICYVTSSLSANGEAFAAWMPVSWSSYFVNATTLPTPPLSIKKEELKNKFAMQTDCIRVITWTPSTDPSVISYLLRRNGALIATIPATGPFTYSDHDRCKSRDVYGVTAVDENGLESTPISVFFK